jgi:TetR/AcrR family transcriptional regulator, cholesterol catabolism regulator
MPARRPSAKAPANAARAARRAPAQAESLVRSSTGAKVRRRAASLPAPLAEGDDINRRGDIVRAAARLFREKGFEGTTVRDIAGAVGMQSGSPFYHFGSKVEMLVAVMEEGLRQGLETTRAVLARELPPRERLRALVEAHLRTIHGPGSDFIPVLLYDWRSLPEAEQRRIVAWRDRYDAAWQSALEALRADGLLAVEPKLARLFILGAINFTALWYRRGGALSLAEVAEAAVDLFVPQVAAAQ